MDHAPPSDDVATYPPLDTLKSIVEDVWIVDGPILRFGRSWPKMPFPTRMTIIRLEGRALFIHSPTPLTPALRRQIAAIGEPRWIVAPNRFHYWCVPEWREAYPDAEVHVAPGVRAQAQSHIVFHTTEMAGEYGHPWDGQIATLRVPGKSMTEFDFFHIASRTLILTDLIENLEPAKIAAPWMRLLTLLAGAQDPDGQTPRDLRLTFTRHRIEVRRAVETMIAWNPARIIIAHGRWYQADAVAELRRALRWVLDKP
jgi:hypothetical protein